MSKRGIHRIDAGQGEKLTVRLNGLIRNYPKGSGILKEFVQNADDAGATCVRITLDQRTHGTGKLTCPAEAEWAGPSLLIFNDAGFSEADFTAIEAIGESSKVDAGWKTGRFGLGFNAAYNVTDYPSLISRDRLVFFDPHRHHPDAQNRKPGGGWLLTEDLWQEHPDLLEPYIAGGLPSGETDFAGTVFRLPLRTLAHAARSEICDEPFTVDDFRQVVGQFAAFSAELLLFLKHVLHIEINEIPPEGGEPHRVLQVLTVNAAEVQEQRDVLNNAVTGDHAALMERLRKSPQSAPHVSYRHRIIAKINCSESQVMWRVVGGLYVDEGAVAVSLAEEMRQHREKALPWAGAAARLVESDTGIEAGRIEGRLFCFLPLPGTTKLPVHINGFFDLDSSRQVPTNDPSLVGKDAVRVRWNRYLAEHAVPRAYAELITDLTKDVGLVNGAGLYSFWPRLRHFTGALESCGRATYSRLAQHPVIRCGKGDAASWSTVNKLRILPDEFPELQEPLVAHGIALPVPRLPDHVVEGFRTAGVTLNVVTPANVRTELRVADDARMPFKDAPLPCLRRRKWVVDLLRFCRSDGEIADLKNVLLILRADGKLQKFGQFRVFLSGADERDLFASQPQWFIEQAFADETGLPPLPQVSVVAMTPTVTVGELKVILGTLPTNQEVGCVAWGPGGEKLPNASWLAKVYRYLSDHAPILESVIETTLQDVPIVPDQQRRRWLPGRMDTPLLVTEAMAEDARFIDALDLFAVPRVHGPAFLVKAIRNCIDAYEGKRLIAKLTGPNLVNTLEATQKSWSDRARRYEYGLHDQVIDFLAEPQWRERYSDVQLRTLATLPLLPTEDGELVRADDPDVYLPTGFKPPLGGPARLLMTKGDRWTPWLRRFVPRRLDDVTYIKSVLLEQYAVLQKAERVEALGWLHEHLPAVERKLAAEDQPAADRLRAAVLAAPLIECTDGKLRPAHEVYHPHNDLVRDVLGDDVPYPDMSVYRVGEDRWLSFFADLDMPEEPQPLDLLSHVDRLVARAGLEGVATVSPKLQVIYDHLREHWDSFKDASVPDPAAGEQATDFAEALARRAWVPSQRDEKRLARYFAAAIPGDRLYRPAELYPARLGHLLASQGPLNPYTEPDVRFRDALGFPKNAPLGLVLAHFDRLLEVWNVERRQDVTPSVVRLSFSAVYEFLGRLARGQQAGPDNADSDEPATDAATTSAAELAALQARYIDLPCLCDESGSRMWRPRHTFKTRCRILEPLRRQLSAKSQDVDAGLSLLGRRDEPTAEDFLEYLRELSSSLAGETVASEVADKVIEVEFQLARSPSEIVGDGSVPVLCDDGCFRAANQVFYFDAPWLEGKFHSEHYHAAHSRSSHVFARAVGMAFVSESVSETLAGSPVRSDGPGAVATAERLTQLIRSSEFAEGLERVIRWGRDLPMNLNLDSLRNVTVECVRELRVELQLCRSDGYVLNDADNNAPFMLSPDGETVYLNERVIRRPEYALAKALTKRLNGIHLNDPALLPLILGLSPTEIHRELNGMQVPHLPWRGRNDFSLDSESVELDEGIEFPTDHEEVDEQADGTAHADSTSTNEVLDPVNQENNGTADISIEDVDTPPPNQNPQPTADATTPAPLAAPSVSTAEDDPATTDASSEHLGQGDPSRTTPPTGGNGRRDELAGDSASNGRDSHHRQPTGDGAANSGDNPINPDRRKSAGKSTGKPNRSPARRGRAVSYAVPEGSDEVQAPDPSDDEQPQNMRVGRAAVAAALREERSRGWRPKAMPHNNKGYDLESTAASGHETRVIEVKGMEGEWDIVGVPVSKAQIEAAQSRGGTFWLYVVEFACDPARRKIWMIQDPYKRATQFRFDNGWAEFAICRGPRDVAASVPLRAADETIPNGVPQANQRVRLPDGQTGTIMAISKTAVPPILMLELDSGDDRTVPWTVGIEIIL